MKYLRHCFYRAVVSRSPGVAAVLAGVVILLGLISVLIELRMVREANKFVTVGGKSTMDRVSTLGRKQILRRALLPSSSC